MAVTCGTPTPATTRVVQIEPGPTPTLTASAPASTSAGPVRGLRALVDGGHLRHAHPGNHPGGADRARTDPDLDRVGAGLDQRQRTLPGSDVAADHVHRRVRGEPADHLQHTPGVAVGGVDHEEVHPGVDQGPAPLVGVLTDAHCGTDHQPTVGVLGGVRVAAVSYTHLTL